MSLFGKKKEENKGCCCCGNCDAESMKQAEEAKTQGASIKVLGSGCKKCIELEANTKEALKQLGMDIHVDHVKDFAQIASYGVMTTPALVYNGKVISYGKVLKVEEIVDLLNKASD